MFKKMVDRLKLSNKNKLLLSILGFGGSLVGGISIALLLQNIWSLVIVLSVVGSLNLWLDLYDDAKREYCYELSDNYFYKNRDNIIEDDERHILNKLVSVNKFCSNIQVATLPVSLFAVLLLSSFGLSLLNALTICGSMCMSSLLLTISIDNVSNFYIDVICEVLEHIKANKNEIAVVNKDISTKKNVVNALSLNPGISKHRFNHMPKDVRASDLSEEEVVEVVTHIGKILQRTNTKR